MVRGVMARRQSGSRGLFREMDSPAPGESLFHPEKPSGAEGMERFRVSAADDPEEVNAERTADRVMGGENLFREADGPGVEGGEAELNSADLAGPGSSLPAELQESMGASIGADFSGVRIHTGAGADRASRRLSARAFAKGRDLYFRDGEYDPGSREGRHLIAHELAHVADGGDGLHRAFNAPGFPSIGSALSDADKGNLSNCVNTVVTTVDGAQVDQMEEKYLKRSLEENKPTREDQEKLQDAQAALAAAKGYISQIDMVDKSGMSAEDQNFLSGHKSTLVAQLSKEAKIDAILAEINPAISRENDMPLSDSVKNMLTSPYFDQFFRAASQIRKAGGSNSLEEKERTEKKAARKAGSAKVNMSAKEKRAYIQHQNELRGIDTGIQDAQDRSGWFGKIGKFAGALGESGVKVSKSAGAWKTADEINSENERIDKDSKTEDKVKAKEAAAKKAEKEGAAITNITASAAEGAGTIGAGFNVAQNSIDAENQRQQDHRAKQSMKNIAGQLERTIPVQLADIPQTGSDGAARSRRIRKVCQQIRRDDFNKGKVPLAQLISDAMDNNPELRPELSDRQKSLLSTLQALEFSRTSSKKEAQKLRQKAIFSSLDALGAGFKSAGGIISGLGSLHSSTANSLLGSILSLTGSIIGEISAIRSKGLGVGEGGDEKDEQAKKMAACRSAIQQMLALPQIGDNDVKDLKKKAEGDTTKVVKGETMAAAEQYAAAFYTIESANVNMSDILFAIEKGEFGKGEGTTHAKSAQASLNDMYANLSFS